MINLPSVTGQSFLGKASSISHWLAAIMIHVLKGLEKDIHQTKFGFNQKKYLDSFLHPPLMEVRSMIFARSSHFALEIILIDCVAAIQAGIKYHSSYFSAQQLAHRLARGALPTIDLARGPHSCSWSQVQNPS